VNSKLKCGYYLAKLKVRITVRFKIVRIDARSAPAYTDSSQTTTPLADSGINDQLVKLRPLVDQTCFEFIDVSYFGAVNFLLHNTPDTVVCRIKVWWIRRPQCRRYEVAPGKWLCRVLEDAVPLHVVRCCDMRAVWCMCNVLSVSCVSVISRNTRCNNLHYRLVLRHPVEVCVTWHTGCLSVGRLLPLIAAIQHSV